MPALHPDGAAWTWRCLGKGRGPRGHPRTVREPGRQGMDTQPAVIKEGRPFWALLLG